MELKKSHKYDLERSRPMRLAKSALAVLFGGTALVLGLPKVWTGALLLVDEFSDSFIEDMQVDFSPEDKMIAAVQTEVQEEVTEKVKPVETVTETEEPPEVITEESVKEEITETPEEPQELEEQDYIPPQEEQDLKPIDRADKEDLELAEQLPEYPGGMSEFVVWLTKTLRYPKVAQSQFIQGEVQVSFIIEKDGSLTDIKIHKGAHPVLNTEALRVAKLMPKWKPGMLKGKVCRTFFIVPIRFEL